LRLGSGPRFGRARRFLKKATDSGRLLRTAKGFPLWICVTG
jgi:hypothetical protein